MKRTRWALLAGALLASLETGWVVLTRHGLLDHTREVQVPGFVARLALAGGLWLAFKAMGRRHVDLAPAVLVTTLLATLAQFQFVGPRVVGDGMMYYVYVRSLWKDFDLDFTNEYAHYGLLRPDRGDLMTPTRTGLRRSIFSIGPAVMWTPGFLAGEAVARVEAWRDPKVDLSGYGPIHWNAVAAGSLLYGFAAVWLVRLFLRRHFAESVALVAALLMWLATFLYWYMVHQPTYAHAPSVFLAALLVWQWDRRRAAFGPWDALVWGLTLGLAMCVRWQNGVFLVLPALELARSLGVGTATRALGERLRHAALVGSALAAGFLAGVLPQLVAWKVLYGDWLLEHPPHGAGFLRLDHPYVLETLFSSRHGLLSWTPILWLGYLGFAPALKRRFALAAPLLAPLLIMSYVNMCAGDWWAGASFSNRRFDSCLPLFALGIAAALEWLVAAVARWPLLVTTLALAPLVLWNLAGVVVGPGAAAGGPRPFPSQVGDYARAVSRTVGSPTTWPASWLFALSHRVTPNRYDRLSGRYLFYRQNNLGGKIDLGTAGDSVLLDGAWGEPADDGGVSRRSLRGRGRVFAPLDLPERLILRIRARATSSQVALGVRVNGTAVGRASLGPDWRDHELEAPSERWHRETNEVTFDVQDGAGSAEIDRIEFVRERP